MPLRQVGISYQVTPELSTAFARTISAERWRTYQRAAGFHEDLAHRLYIWNATIGQSFHFPLQCVEVALRNVVHQALCRLFGQNWSSDQACRNIFRPKQDDDITKAERRHYSIYRQPASTPQIVASLSLGFWAAMLRKEYNRPIWSGELQEAFPTLAENQRVVDVSRTATRVQDLRNRIFHQEPLIGHNLSQNYSDIVQLLGWICPQTRDWMRRHSSVPLVMRERPR